MKVVIITGYHSFIYLLQTANYYDNIHAVIINDASSSITRTQQTLFYVHYIQKSNRSWFKYITYQQIVTDASVLEKQIVS